MRVALACVCAVLLSGNVFAQNPPQPAERRAPHAESSKGPQHVAIVIDCSIQNKRAFERLLRQATRAIERLTERDTVSVVVFDDAAELLVPATSAADREHILEKFKGLKPKGMKALFAGIAKGAEEVRRNATEGQTKRVLVLSGHGSGALIGPGSEKELGLLKKSLGKEQITLVIQQSRAGGNRGGRSRGRQGGKGGDAKRVK